MALTDKDILSELILNSAKTIIYYHDQSALKQLIANLNIIITQEKLITKTSDGSIVFEKQPE